MDGVVSVVVGANQGQWPFARELNESNLAPLDLPLTAKKSTAGLFHSRFLQVQAADQANSVCELKTIQTPGIFVKDLMTQLFGQAQGNGSLR